MLIWRKRVALGSLCQVLPFFFLGLKAYFTIPIAVFGTILFGWILYKWRNIAPSEGGD